MAPVAGSPGDRQTRSGPSADTRCRQPGISSSCRCWSASVAVRLRYSCSLTVKLALIGSSVETVVTALADGPDEIADLCGGHACDAIDRRYQVGKAEIDFGGFDSRGRGRHGGLRRFDLRLARSPPGPGAAATCAFSD